MMTPAVRTQKGARLVVFGIIACVIALLFLGAWVIRTYTIDRDDAEAQRLEDKAQAEAQRAEDKEQIDALEDGINVLVTQSRMNGIEPVIDSAAEISPDAPPPPLPGRDGRDGTSPPCLSTPTQCQGADGATPADGTNGVDGNNGIDGTNGVDGTNGQDSTVPGPEGPPCPPGTTGGFRPAPLPSTETYWLCVVDPP